MTRILTPFRPQSTSEVAQGIDFSRKWRFITGAASFKRGLTQFSISGMTSNPLHYATNRADYSDRDRKCSTLPRHNGHRKVIYCPFQFGCY